MSPNVDLNVRVLGLQSKTRREQRSPCEISTIPFLSSADRRAITGRLAVGSSDAVGLLRVKGLYVVLITILTQACKSIFNSTSESQFAYVRSSVNI